MDNKSLLTYVYGTLAVFLVVATLSVGSMAMSFSRSSDSTNYRVFSVSAEGKAVATPDVAEFSFTVFTQGGNERAALEEENSLRQKDVVKVLADLDIDEKDIRTESYSVEPRYKYFQCKSDGSCPPAQIEGYTVSQTTSVKVRDLNIVNDVVGAVTDQEVNNISQLSFVVDDKTELENEARAKAIELAKAKAKATAKAAGFRLGKLTSLSENFTPYYAESMSARGGVAMMDKAMDSAMTEPAVMNEVVVNPGSQEINVTVNLTYSIR